MLWRAGASLNSRKLAWTRLKFTNFYGICMSDIRRHIEFPAIDIRVNRVLYESRELGMSCDDLRTTCTDLPTSYQDLLTSDKSYLRVMRSRGGKCIILVLSKIEVDARSIIICSVGKWSDHDLLHNSGWPCCHGGAAEKKRYLQEEIRIMQRRFWACKPW